MLPFDGCLSGVNWRVRENRWRFDTILWILEFDIRNYEVVRAYIVRTSLRDARLAFAGRVIPLMAG